jgi:hypothetical protein
LRLNEASPSVQGTCEVHPLFPRTEDDLNVPAAGVEVACRLRVHFFGRDIGRDEMPATAFFLPNAEGVASEAGFFARFAEVFFGDFDRGSDGDKAGGLGFFPKGHCHVDELSFSFSENLQTS